MSDIKEILSEKIKTGDIHMVPKWQFVLHTVLWAVGAVLAAVVAVYLFSFVLFILHRSGILFAPLYGWHGIMLFIISSPWFLISLVGVFLLVLYLLVTHFAFSYKRPLVYSMLGVVLFVIVLSSLMNQFAVHERMGRFSERHEVPGFSPMYRGIEMQRPEEVTLGTILAVHGEEIVVRTQDGEEVTVIRTLQTKQPQRKTWNSGDEVFIFGTEKEGVIEAFGIRPANGRMSGPPPQGSPKRWRQ